MQRVAQRVFHVTIGTLQIAGAQIIGKQFSIDTIKQISGVRLFDNLQQKQAIQSGQVPPPPGIKQDTLATMLEDPTWEEVEALIRDNCVRSFRIDIETDSIIKGDQQQDRQDATEFLTAAGGFLQQAVQAGQQQPDMIPLLAQMLMFGVRRFPIGKELESAFNVTLRKLEQAAAQPRPPQQSPDAIKAQAENYRAQFGPSFDASLMERPEVRQGILDRVISEKLVVLAAEKSGIRVGDRQLAERNMSEPAVQEDGKCSKARYDAIARAQGWTPQGLDERLRDEMELNFYRDAIAATAIVPRATLDAFIRLSEQSREVSVITIGPDAFLAGVKVSEPEVEAYYKANAAEFTNPEQVRVEMLDTTTQ
mgnify:CR=1 FL=1